MITDDRGRSAQYHTDIHRRQQAQRAESWAFLVTHNYELIFGTHPLEVLTEEEYHSLLTQYYKDRVNHVDAARAIHETEVLPRRTT